MTLPLRKPHPGDRLSAQEVGRVWEEVEKISKLNVAPPLEIIHGPAGALIRLPPEYCFARVTGVTSGSSTGSGSASGGYGPPLYPGVVVRYDDTTGAEVDVGDPVWIVNLRGFALSSDPYRVCLVGSSNSRLIYATTDDVPVSTFNSGDGSPTQIEVITCVEEVDSSGTIGWEYYRQNGQYYFAGLAASATGVATGGPTAAQIIAMPFISGRSCVIDRLAINSATNAGTAACHLGIYANTSNSNLYPSHLIVDGGALTVLIGSGLSASTISQGLAGNQLYWIAYLSNSATVVISCLPSDGLLGILGGTATNFSGATPGVAWKFAQTYGALPATFPGTSSTATIVNAGTTMPLIGLRYLS